LIGTVAENVLTHGTGAINVGGCRVVNEGGTKASEVFPNTKTNNSYGNGLNGNKKPISINNGRWPANIIHDGSAEVLAGFPETQSSYRPNSKGKIYSKNLSYFTNKTNNAMQNEGQNDKGSAARFFYCAKASKKDRDEGLEGFEEKKAGAMAGIETREGKPTNHPMRSNHHPTVKPTNLMQYLCRLVTPKNGLILDPFLGSGSTGKAAMYEGFRFIGFDLNQEYIDIAKARIQYAIKMNNESSGKKENTLFEDEE
jgi:site-specific DNA-methyltransferase (adenine-specific)